MEFVLKQSINGREITDEEYIETKFPQNDLIAQIIENVKTRLFSTRDNNIT